MLSVNRYCCDRTAHWTPTEISTGRSDMKQHGNVLTQKKVRGLLFGYGLAVVTTAFSALLRWLLPGALSPAPYLVFYPAVVVSAALGGVGPGLVSTFGSLLLVNLVFVQFNIADHGAMMRQVIWVVSNIGVSILAGKLRTARIQAEQIAVAAHESDERLQSVLRSSTVGTFEVNLQSGTGAWNDVEFELLGLKPSETPPNPESFFRYVHPDDIAELTAKWEEALQTGNLDAEFRIVRADGTERWLAGKGRFAFDDAMGRGALRFMGVNYDITERKQAEEAVSRSQKIFNDLIENSPFGNYIVDSQFRIVMMNASTQTGAFRNVQPVIGRNFAEAMHILWPEDVAEGIISRFRHTLDTGEPYYSRDFINLRNDEKNIEAYEWELHRIMLPDGQNCVICYYFDSTKLRLAEAALQDSEQQFRVLIQNLQSAVALINERGEFTIINKSFLRIFKLDEFSNIKNVNDCDWSQC